MPDEVVSTEVESGAVDEGSTNADFESQVAEMKSLAADPADQGEAEGEVPDPEVTADKPAETKEKETAKEKGLRLELKRVRDKAREKDEKYEDTRERLARVEGQLEGSKTAVTAEDKLKDHSDRDLIRLQLRWEDARDEARGQSDAETVEKARSNIEALRLELHRRGTAQAAAEASAKSYTDLVNTQAATMIQAAEEAWPELKDRESAIWKAAQAQYESAPQVYKKLGPFADMVAISAALAADPKLLGKGVERKARVAIVKDLEKATETALKAGGGAAQIKSQVVVDDMSTDDIESAAERLKAGGKL